MRAEERDETAAALRERLQAADAGIEPPDGLWDRVRAQREVTVVEAPRPRRRPVPLAVIAVAAAAVVFVVCGTWWLVSPSGAGSSGTTSPARPPGDAVTMRVHNAEKPCRKLHTLECSLRVAKNPYVLYAQPDNSVGRVWHGDEVRTTCVVTDGEMVTDEAGLSSRRWYRVEKARDGGNAGFVGWLPGVRTRNSTEVPVCSGADKPAREGS